VGAALVTHWSWGLLRVTSGVLLDRQAPEALRRGIVERLERPGDARVADLHVWSIGPGLYAAEIGIVSPRPAPPAAYKARLADVRAVAHVTVEVHEHEPARDPARRLG
jgi:Co/Zn/Cd efflux system component